MFDFGLKKFSQIWSTDMAIDLGTANTLVASANAYLNALNKMIIKRKKTAPDEHQQQKNYQQQKMKGI